jgi:hypothetical protein
MERMHVVEWAMAAAHRKCSGYAVVSVHRGERDGFDDYIV